MRAAVQQGSDVASRDPKAKGYCARASGDAVQNQGYRHPSDTAKRMHHRCISWLWRDSRTRPGTTRFRRHEGRLLCPKGFIKDQCVLSRRSGPSTKAHTKHETFHALSHQLLVACTFDEEQQVWVIVWFEKQKKHRYQSSAVITVFSSGAKEAGQDAQDTEGKEAALC